MNPSCICDELFASWEEEGVDAEDWLVEETQRVLYGHYASCNHQSPEPRGILQASPKRARGACPLGFDGHVIHIFEHGMATCWCGAEPLE